MVMKSENQKTTSFKHMIVEFMQEKNYTQNPKYVDLICNLHLQKIPLEEIEFYKEMYFSTKDLFTRNQIIKLMVLHGHLTNLKDFFFLAFKRERYLEMKLEAIIGYSIYASEDEVIPLMNKFIELLKNRQKSTPNNYQEYEYLRSQSYLPYLIEKYGYECFKKAYKQEELQYDAMEEKYKNLIYVRKWIY